jgi:hypothetical protein
MILEIISRVVSGITVLGWMVSLCCFTKNEVWEAICCCISAAIFVVGFVTCLNTVFYG